MRWPKIYVCCRRLLVQVELLRRRHLQLQAAHRSARNYTTEQWFVRTVFSDHARDAAAASLGAAPFVLALQGADQR